MTYSFSRKIVFILSLFVTIFCVVSMPIVSATSWIDVQLKFIINDKFQTVHLKNSLEKIIDCERITN